MVTTQANVPVPGRDVPITIAANLPARIHREHDGAMWADARALPGCIAGGENLDEVLANLKEAAEGWLLAKGDIEIIGWPPPAAGKGNTSGLPPA
jgi:predicted RNase H-like HicB family nuclease